MISKLILMVRLWLNPPPSELELRLIAILERQEAELAKEAELAAERH